MHAANAQELQAIANGKPAPSPPPKGSSGPRLGCLEFHLQLPVLGPLLSLALTFFNILEYSWLNCLSMGSWFWDIVTTVWLCYYRYATVCSWMEFWASVLDNLFPHSSPHTLTAGHQRPRHLWVRCSLSGPDFMRIWRCRKSPCREKGEKEKKHIVNDKKASSSANQSQDADCYNQVAPKGVPMAVPALPAPPSNQQPRREQCVV